MDDVQRRLDDLYAGRRKLATGPARTRELFSMLDAGGRRSVLAALLMCPRSLRGEIGE